MAGLTPFQTVGPYLSIGLRAGVDAVPADHGQAIVIRGRLLDGAGAGIPDGVLEWWHPALTTVLRSLTGPGGEFAVHTVKPPALDERGAIAAPHLAVRVLARGVLTQYVTRVYFPDEAAAEHDPVLQLVPAARRATLVAAQESTNEYRFDVIVQGDRETVFFEI